MVRESSNRSRRRFLKQAGAAATATALAGCSGILGSQEDSEVGIVISPFGFAGVVFDQMLEETNRLENRMSDAGYTIKAQESWDEAALFAAGGPDFADLAPIEAAQLATERDLDLAVTARTASYFTGFITKSGGPYDTDTTGDLESSIQKIAEEGQVAIGSWGGGDVLAYRVLIEDLYGLQFTEEDSDFEVVTADYFALPDLAADGEAAAISTAPHYGAAPMFVGENPELTGLFWSSDALNEAGYGQSALNTWTCKQEFAENNPEAVSALVSSWEETIADFYERPYELATQEKYMEMLAVENEQQAEYLIEWGVENQHSYDTPVLYEDITYSEQRIEEETSFIDRYAELGEISADWNDSLEFRTV